MYKMTNNDLQLLYEVMTNYYHCTFRFTERRGRDITDKRAMFSVIARHFGAKHIDIAQFLQLKSHSNVVHSVKVMKDYIDVYPAFKKQYVDICDEYWLQKSKEVPAQ